MPKAPARPHPLDGTPRWLQIPLALALAAIPLSALYALTRVLGGLGPIVTAPFLAPFIGPLMTPLFAELGIFRYRSRFLVLMPRLPRGFSLHLGTGLDLLLRRRELGGRWSGAAVRRRLGASALEGLLAIAEDVDAGRMRGDTVLVATSYVFSRKTAEALGFEVETVGLLDRLLFAVGWIDASLWHSVQTGRIGMVPLSGLVRARTTAQKIADDARPKIEALVKRIARVQTRRARSAA